MSGRTKRELEKRFQGDFYRLKGKIKIPKNYWLQLAYLGTLSSFSASLNYEPIEIDFSRYDEVVLGSPVWAWTITPFMKKFLKANNFSNKKVTLLLTHEGGPGKSMIHFKKRIDKSNTVINEISIRLGSAYEESTINKRK